MWFYFETQKRKLSFVVGNCTFTKQFKGKTSGGAASSHHSTSVVRIITFSLLQNKPVTPFQTVQRPFRFVHVTAQILSRRCGKWTGVSSSLCWSLQNTTSSAGSTTGGLCSGCRKTGGYSTETQATLRTFSVNRASLSSAGTFNAAYYVIARNESSTNVEAE